MVWYNPISWFGGGSSNDNSGSSSNSSSESPSPHSSPSGSTPIGGGNSGFIGSTPNSSNNLGGTAGFGGGSPGGGNSGPNRSTPNDKSAVEKEFNQTTSHPDISGANNPGMSTPNDKSQVEAYFSNQQNQNKLQVLPGGGVKVGGVTYYGDSVIPGTQGKTDNQVENLVFQKARQKYGPNIRYGSYSAELSADYFVPNQNKTFNNPNGLSGGNGKENKKYPPLDRGYSSLTDNGMADTTGPRYNQYVSSNTGNRNNKSSVGSLQNSKKESGFTQLIHGATDFFVSAGKGIGKTIFSAIDTAGDISNVIYSGKSYNSNELLPSDLAPPFVKKAVGYKPYVRSKNPWAYIEDKDVQNSIMLEGSVLAGGTSTTGALITKNLGRAALVYGGYKFAKNPSWYGAGQVTALAIGPIAETYPKGVGFVRTYGRAEVPIEDLVPKDVLAGEEAFPSVGGGKNNQQIAEEQLKLFQENTNRLPGQTKAGGFHATGDITFTKSGEFTIGGEEGNTPLHISTDISPNFLRLPGGKGTGEDSASFIDSLLSPFKTGKTGALQVTPNDFEVNVGHEIGRAKGYSFENPTKPGIAYIPGQSTEIEAILQPGTKVVKTGNSFYSKFNGIRFPIDEFTVLNENKMLEEGISEPSSRAPGRKVISYSGLPEVDYSAYDQIQNIAMSSISEGNKKSKGSIYPSPNELEMVSEPNYSNSKSSRKISIAISELTNNTRSRRKSKNKRSSAPSYEDILSEISDFGRGTNPYPRPPRPSRNSKSSNRNVSGYSDYEQLINEDFLKSSKAKKGPKGKNISRKRNSQKKFSFIDNLAIEQDFTAKILGLKPQKINAKNIIKEFKKQSPIGIRKGVIID